jgi:hypothetical protein
MGKPERIALWIGIIFLASMWAITIYISKGITEENEYYKDILFMYGTMGNDYAISANKYYELSSLDYEQKDWDGTIKNCELAREDYSSAAQEVRDEIVEIENKQGEVFETGELLFKEEVKIYNNLYEACEHFESASRYFKIYYDDKTPASDTSIDMGNGEIEAMNEKISAHDYAVGEYNTYLAKLNKMIKEVK